MLKCLLPLAHTAKQERKFLYLFKAGLLGYVSLLSVSAFCINFGCASSAWNQSVAVNLGIKLGGAPQVEIEWGSYNFLRKPPMTLLIGTLREST